MISFKGFLSEETRRAKLARLLLRQQQKDSDDSVEIEKRIPRQTGKNHGPNQNKHKQQSGSKRGVTIIYPSKDDDITEAIKLGGGNDNPNIANFMKDFHATSQAHPFNHRVRILHNTMVEVSPFGGEIHIGDIQTMAPRTGAATAAIGHLKNLANKHGVTLSGISKVYVKDKQYITKQPDLDAFYKKQGFDVHDLGDESEIRYKPRKLEEDRDDNPAQKIMDNLTFQNSLRDTRTSTEIRADVNKERSERKEKRVATIAMQAAGKKEIEQRKIAERQRKKEEKENIPPSKWDRMIKRLNDKLADPNDSVNIRIPRGVGHKGKK